MAEVKMPKLSDTMEEGTVLEWKKKDGEEIKRGDVLAEVESDKASFELEAEADGKLQIVVQAGTPAPVGALIAQIGGEMVAVPQSQPKAPAEQPKKPTPAPPPPSPPPSPVSAPTDRIKASPLARRLAQEEGLDLSKIRGSGPGGRIVKEDIASAGNGTPKRAPLSAESIPLNRMQTTIARRMVESKSAVPHFYLTIEARVDAAVELRSQLKATIQEASRLTMTDLLTRACAIALTRFPEVNSSWAEDHIERKASVNIGIAVPPQEGMGLLVPVVKDCDRKDLLQLSIETRQIIERARSGRPNDGDLFGGTFSISNLGMYGIEEFSAIVNPPESAILAVGQIKDAPIVENGQIKAAKLMKMTLSSDHRVLYGATAAQFLGEIKKLLENPAILTLSPALL